jgi:TrmH family RNA methyltransferase
VRDSANSIKPEPTIQSPHNPTLKYVRSLQSRKTRQLERAFVVEGMRAIRDALAAGAAPMLLLTRDGVRFLTDGLDPRLLSRAKQAVVASTAFAGLTDTVSPQGVLAVFPFPDLPLPATRSPLYLLLDRVSDPGNLGTLLRSAAGAGVTAVYLSPETVDPFNPKAVRAGMGAHFRVPLRTLTDPDFALIDAACPLRVLADAAVALPYDALDWTQPAALIVGSEASGPSEEWRTWATKRVAIPLAAEVESLNAAVAGSIILFEAARQRRRGPRRGARPPLAE